MRTSSALAGSQGQRSPVTFSLISGRPDSLPKPAYGIAALAPTVLQRYRSVQLKAAQSGTLRPRGKNLKPIPFNQSRSALAPAARPDQTIAPIANRHTACLHRDSDGPDRAGSAETRQPTELDGSERPRPPFSVRWDPQDEQTCCSRRPLLAALRGRLI